MKTTYHGSCHCGAIQFKCTLDLSVTSRCNCSICRKSRFWKAIAPASEFRLTKGEEELAEYSFGNHAIRHRAAGGPFVLRAQGIPVPSAR